MCFYFMYCIFFFNIFFFFNDTATTEIYTLSLHDALPISTPAPRRSGKPRHCPRCHSRSEEHTSELQSRLHLVCRLLLEKKKNNQASRLEAIKRNTNTIKTTAFNRI